ncbi:hypothetical protein ACGFIE_09520 [Micromonospora sp. NPDC049275]|uniref:hypothetical protein n=1 Tax=Micromonospora sp. NPDC049275 TaxID=3364268 RepID=UPI003719B102
MTVVWVVAGGFVAVAGLAVGVVARRGRGRPGAGDDRAAGRDARARQQRYEAERQGDQGATWQRGRESGG